MHFPVHVMSLFDFVRYVIIYQSDNTQITREPICILRLKHLSYVLGFQLLLITCFLFPMCERQHFDFLKTITSLILYEGEQKE